MESNNDVLLFSLPSELLAAIFNRLDCLANVIRSERTSKHWRKIVWGSVCDIEITNRYQIGLKTLANILSRTSPSQLRGITAVISKEEELDSEDLRVFEKLTRLNKIGIEAAAKINIGLLVPYITHIQQLRLSYCVNDDGFNLISSFLTNLRVLNIEGGKTIHLPGLKNLTRLQELNLFHNKQLTSEALNDVFTLTNLTYLNLFSCGHLFKDGNIFDSISALKKLNYLCINSEDYRSEYSKHLTALLTLPNLENLLFDNLFDTSLAVIGHLTALTKFGGNLAIGNASPRGLDFLSNLTKLKELEIDYPENLNRPYFTNMVNLTKMIGSINGNQAKSLLNLTRIRVLDIQTDVSMESDFFESIAGLRSLEHLILNESTVAGLGFKWLTALDHLTCLNINRSHITVPESDLTAEIIALTRLRKLYLRGGDFNRLAALTNLEELLLETRDYKAVHASQLSALVTLPRLRRLYCGTADPQQLQAMFAASGCATVI